MRASSAASRASDQGTSIPPLRRRPLALRYPDGRGLRLPEGPAALVTTSANEKFFSNGLDLDWLGASGEHRGGDREPFGREFMALMGRIITFPMPTLCAITGVLINASDFDGEDTSASWFGKGTHVRTKPLLWKTSSPGSESLIRDGQWKLRHPTRKNDGVLELYDITADPAESNNLAEKHPEIVNALSAKVETWVNTLPKEYLKTKDKQD